MLQDKLVVSIVDEKGSKQFALPRNVKKLILIGIAVISVLFLASFLAMNLLMHQINSIAKQKDSTIAEYHSIYQKNAVLKNLIRKKTDELSAVNSKIGRLEDIMSLQKSHSAKPQQIAQITKVDLENLSDTQKQLLLSLIPNGDPLKNFRSKVPTTNNKYHPLGEIGGAEGGMDYMAEKKTPVYATADGVVVLVQEHGVTSFGNVIRLTHSFGFGSLYAHLDSIVIKKGDFVQKGQLIGYSGSSGRSNGDKLYYEVSFLNNRLNPTTYAQWSIDNFEVVFHKRDGIDWKNLVWAMEDIAKLQKFRLSSAQQKLDSAKDLNTRKSFQSHQ